LLYASECGKLSRVKRTSLEHVSCSIARTVDVIGEWWTPLILRDVFLGITRFEDLRRDLGIATNVLADRLDTLVARGILERRPYGGGASARHEYALTEKGRELYPVMLAITAWGDRWMSSQDGPPATMVHDECGGEARPEVMCGTCGGRLTSENVSVHPGPGGRLGPGAQVLGELLLSGPLPRRPD
jgi:DNA-binding HxlR family transcriptional regulator